MANAMSNGAIEQILENLFHVLPMVHKKLLRMDLGGATGEFSRLHLAIMGMLWGESQAVSEVARKLSIPKSQMTQLIDQLEERGIVLRHPDANDRRVTNITLTGHGREVLTECKRRLKDIIRQRLSVLAETELAEMAAALEKLKNIGAKLE
jgi:DNA-binding MarR family transcriptional regulator